MDPKKEEVVVTERTDPEAQNRALESARSQARAEERKRSEDIHAAVTKAGLDAEFARELISGDVSIEMAREKIIDKLHERSKSANNQVGGKVSMVQDEKVNLMRGMEEKILTRIAPQIQKPTELSLKFRSHTLLDMCKDVVRWQGKDPLNYSRSEIIRAALHTSSDFGITLANSTKKVLTNY